jgi:DNA repair exonuclease SbcCD nuclease subunit
LRHLAQSALNLWRNHTAHHYDAFGEGRESGQCASDGFRGASTSAFEVYCFGHCHPRDNISENKTTDDYIALYQGSNEKADFASIPTTALLLLICMALALVVAS